MNDYNLLKRLYEIHSPSGHEGKMRKFIRKQCRRAGAEVAQDTTGNLYVTKGYADTYPCICAHIDQVQQEHAKDFTVIRKDDIIFAYSPSAKEQQGLGADDKNGVWIALELLRELDALKCAFFVGEEVGCVGSNQADMDFFKDVRFCIEPDRRNGSDLITNISGDICSKAFLEAIGYEAFGYKPTTGLMTDVETLCENGIGVSCINISCGYYHPHTDQECTSWSELLNARNFALHICTTLTDTYAHTYENKWADYWYGGGKGKHSGSWDYWYTRPYDDKKLYDAWEEDDDYETMRTILFYEDYLTFDEVVRLYGNEFKTKDKYALRDMYDDALREVEDSYFNTNEKTDKIA